MSSNIYKLKNYIDGKWVESSSKIYEDVYNPATGNVIAKVPLSNYEDLKYAVEVAKKAFDTWKNTPIPKRARILFKYQ